MEEKKIKLRPVVYTSNIFKRGSQNTAQQMFLLRALQITQDPDKLRKMIHVKTVAEVYRTLDKLIMRKEYHEALNRLGISFDYIAGGIKGIADTGHKDADRLNALKTLLKSVGMENYDEKDGGSSGTWEEELLKVVEASKEKPGDTPVIELQKYDVKQPIVPESVRKSKEDEEEITSSIYEKK